MIHLTVQIPLQHTHGETKKLHGKTKQVLSHTRQYRKYPQAHTQTSYQVYFFYRGCIIFFLDLSDLDLNKKSFPFFLE